MYLPTDQILYLTADDVLACAEDSQSRNRAINLDTLNKELDPNGISLIVFKMNHNGHEWRTIMMIKVKDSMSPIEVFCDFSFEIMERIESRQDRIKMFLGLEGYDGSTEVHTGTSGQPEESAD